MSGDSYGMGSVYKRKDGYWVSQLQIGIYENGKKKYKRFTGAKKSDVIKKMKEFQLNGGYKTDNTKIYLEEYLESYLLNVKRHVLKPSSFDGNFATYRCHIKPYIGHYYITDLTVDTIQIQLINKLKEDGFSYSTINKAYVLTNEALNHALRNDKIKKNPCSFVVKPAKMQFNKKEISFLNDVEIKQFIDQATKLTKTGKSRYTHGLAITLIIYTGLRAGELCALKWSDIDFVKRNMVIQRNIVPTYNYDMSDERRVRLAEQNSTKTAVNRTIPLNETSIGILRKLQGANRDIADYVITNSSKMIGASSISNIYRRIARAAGISNPQGIHTLRHTFASLLIRRGVDIKVVSELLGHSNISFTYNTYVHLIDEQKQTAVDLLDDI